MAQLILLLAGYLIGSLSFAVIVSRALGLPDPHTYGSGNPGATNVLRSGSRLAAILTLVGDAMKGLVVVLIAKPVASRFGLSPDVIALAGLSAFIGHLYPVFFRFRGGKGVATAAGVLFGFSGWLGLAVLAVWLAAFVATRISSVGALTAALAAPGLAWALGSDRSTIAVVFVMSALLLWRHRENIRKLRAGAEASVSRRQG